MSYRLNKKYKPLLQSDTRYVIITGGRGSGKSFALACSVLASTYDDPYTILYTRWNMTSAEVSIIPEYRDKIELGDCTSAFLVRQRDIVNLGTGGKVLFRGLQASSKNQIAKLKSLTKLKIWVLDEAQELMDESLFDTIDLSVREKGVKNKVILVLNPPSIQHWIYKRFFAGMNVQEGFNGVKGDVTYIHTTYLDNQENLSESFMERANRMKESDPDKYNNIFLGMFAKQTEGLIYKNWQKIRPEEYPSTLPQWYGVDWGYTDWPNAMVRMCYDPARGILYLWQVKPVADPSEARLTRGAAKAIIADAASLVHHTEKAVNENGVTEERPVYYQPYDCECYCDPARPENIAELRTKYDISAMKAINRDKVGRIHYLQGFRVCYVGDDIGREVQTYSWQRDKQNKGLFIDKPQDGNDHFLDAVSYGSQKLRQLGVNGED